MPVTARLSQRFYERFGDDITNELVDWFNAVDSTYQSQVRELNELNAKRIDARFEAVDARFETIDARFDALEAKFDAKLATQKAELLRWMFVFWAGTVVPLGGLIVGLATVLRG